ncbi:MAG: TolC family protein [Alphaproteobacteria bacterium]|jgi:outer membrane protein, heavy metal efflux system|nr:MAG: TolC family protein [Alphaproteobacteria bacterium]
MPVFGLHIRILGVALAAFVVVAEVAYADPTPDFFVLLERAKAAPRISAGEAEVAAAEARALQAEVGPNPSLSLEVENFGGKGLYQGTDASETTLSIGQLLELGGKREARIAAASLEAQAVRAQQTRNTSDFAAELAVAYARAEASAELAKLTAEAVGLAEGDAKTTRALVDSGREAELRFVQASAELARVRAELVQARAAEASAFARLTAFAGSKTPFDSIAVSLLSREPRATAVAGGTAPAVAVAQAESRAASAKVTIEERRWIPDITITGGVRSFASTDETAVVAGLSIPLPLFDQNRGGSAAARSEALAASLRLERAQSEADADRRAALAGLAAASQFLSAQLEVERASAEAYRLAQVGYEAGRVPLLELASVRRSLIETRRQTINIRLARVAAEAEAARVTGRLPFGE